VSAIAHAPVAFRLGKAVLKRRPVCTTTTLDSGQSFGASLVGTFVGMTF
jgi:hypothetical protein